MGREVRQRMSMLVELQSCGHGDGETRRRCWLNSAYDQYLYNNTAPSFILLFIFWTPGSKDRWG